MNPSRTLTRSLVGLSMLFASTVSLAQTPAASQPNTHQPNDSDEKTGATSQPTTEPAKYVSPLLMNYSGDLMERPAFTGDWWNARNWLSEKGVNLDVQVVSYAQGNAYGGRSTNGAFEYFGTADYALNLDLNAMGLWPGAFMRIRGQTNWGQGVNLDAGAISPVNFETVMPEPGPSGLTTLTEYWMVQYVSPKLGFIFGMVDTTLLPGGNVFSSGRYDQFMNTSLWFPPVLFSTVPATAMTVGAFYTFNDWLSGTTLVLDPYGQASYSGFSSAFHSPTDATVLQGFTFKVKPWDKPGHQRIFFTWSSREKVPVDSYGRLILSGVAASSNNRLILPSGGPRPLRKLWAREVKNDTEGGNWNFWYNFDQYVWTRPEDPKQGWGVFGSFAWAGGNVNPVAESYTLGIGGTGMVPKRPKDKFGIGYYYLNMSNDLAGVFQANAEQGIEIFYNIEITPWLHITPDLQVIIDPGGNTGEGARDPAIVYGIRAQMNF